MLAFVLMIFGRRAGAGGRASSDADEDLMERFRDGDAKAFEVLLERHERGVFHFIFRFTQDRELANDLMQESFLRVVKNAKSYSRKARFTTWLYTIARNQCIDASRKARYRRADSLDAPVAGDPDGRPLGETIAGHSDEGFDRTDRAEMTRRIDGAIAQLSEEQREVFLMREIMQLQFNEIAEIVGISENTVKSRMRYALENLRLRLADYAADVPNAADPVAARHRA
jgi:RNA polymerase sigma-70 factor (ECF subfamily)